MTISAGLRKSTGETLTRLRAKMADFKLDAYIIPSEDAHQSEYISASDGRRAYVSGFTGSAGLCVVTKSQAALWTDGRYFLQASKQLDENWILQKSGMPGVPTKEEWLNQVLPRESTIGVDPKLFTVSAARVLKKELSRCGNTVSLLHDNLVDMIWTNRPAIPKNDVFALDIKFSGQSTADKIQNLRKSIQEKKTWGFIVNALDEIAWLFNLRGSDIPFNPVFFAYAVVTVDEAILYIDESKLTTDAKVSLKGLVSFKPYDSVFDDLSMLCKNYLAADSNSKLWLDPRCSIALQDAVGGESNVFESRSPVMIAKSIKNPVELQGFRDCHVRDALALCSYFSWLEKELVERKNTKLTEVEAADKLESFRKELSLFMGLSFDTISSTGPNGAIIHYKAVPESCSAIKVEEMYLCDSGGQYMDGTTDVTRTMHFGTPTQHEKDAFTRVLKGHIQLDRAIFPKGTTGFVLDVISRLPLWQAGLDFRHGTGHGVGSFLNVHEGPQGIAPRIVCNDVALEPGMTITNEPGYYEDGKFGIRIENIMLVKKVDTPHQFGDIPYYGFEHVTVVPIQTKLISVELLTSEELEWINSYHALVREKLEPLMTSGSDVHKWLLRETMPL